jgi:hypothetical protein
VIRAPTSDLLDLASLGRRGELPSVFSKLALPAICATGMALLERKPSGVLARQICYLTVHPIKMTGYTKSNPVHSSLGSKPSVVAELLTDRSDTMVSRRTRCTAWQLSANSVNR